MVETNTIYVLPTDNYGPEHFEFALRFVATYLSFPPGMSHSLHVVSNGGPPSREAEVLFATIPEFKRFIIRENNFAKDIGAFQYAALDMPDSLLLFFGGNNYFKREGWMARVTSSFLIEGDHLYGAFGSLVVRPHIRTNGFWCSRELFTRYPRIIRDDNDRYTFEHRDGNFTDYAKSRGRKALMVTWSGVHGEGGWHHIKDAYYNGTHDECLFGDKVSDIVQPIKG